MTTQSRATARRMFSLSPRHARGSKAGLVMFAEANRVCDTHVVKVMVKAF